MCAWHLGCMTRMLLGGGDLAASGYELHIHERFPLPDGPALYASFQGVDSLGCKFRVGILESFGFEDVSVSIDGGMDENRLDGRRNRSLPFRYHNGKPHRGSETKAWSLRHELGCGPQGLGIYATRI